jgi:hypothetical protein
LVNLCPLPMGFSQGSICIFTSTNGLKFTVTNVPSLGDSTATYQSQRFDPFVTQCLSFGAYSHAPLRSSHCEERGNSLLLCPFFRIFAEIFSQLKLFIACNCTTH